MGAKLAPFAGWEMPLEYPGGTLKEHAAVRESVGVFDVSHMGKVRITGEGAVEFANRVLTNDLRRTEPGNAQYTLLCDPATGGVVDDLIAYVIGEDELLLVPNAANADDVVSRLSAAAPEPVTVADEHLEHAILAVQGPLSEEVLERMGLPRGHRYMSFVPGELAGRELIVCRTGYTGERGYELIVPAPAALEVWDAIAQAGRDVCEGGVRPCGLSARDTLRCEVGYPLHGQDLDAEITPVQARLSWAVGWSKPDFWGRDVLAAEREQGPSVISRGLVAKGRAIPRPGMRVLLTPDVPVGRITSGTFSPTLRQGIALSLVDPQVTDGAEVLVDVRGRHEVFVVTKPPFVTPHVS